MATAFAYDSRGQIVAITNAQGRSISLSYDSAGNLARIVEANGNTSGMVYDHRNRVIQAIDFLGLVIRETDQLGNQTSFQYDASGKLASRTDALGRTMTYSYDAMGKRAAMTMPDGGQVRYSYDAANRLAGIASFLGDFSLSYDATGRRIGLAYPNGVTTGYYYGPTGRLTSILAQGGRGTVSGFTYTHDGVGNRLSRTVAMDGHDLQSLIRHEYTYDANYQLLQALPVAIRQEREHERDNRSENFVYGAVGNRLSGPSSRDTSVYNELNQLLASRTEDFRYNANGNLIARIGSGDADDDGDDQRGWTYEYDEENRLTKATRAGEHGSRAISFKYDPFGRRIEKRVEETEHGRNEAKIFTYVYDNEDIVLEISGNTTSRYVHGPGIDEPLAVEQRRDVYFFHADGLGSIVNLTDRRGRVVQSYEYSAFGRMKEHGGEVKQPYGFTGREWDRETGLYYYRTRYYDPVSGRFISRDPIGFEGGDVNLYRYVGNQPVDWADPWGLYPGEEYVDYAGGVLGAAGDLVGAYVDQWWASNVAGRAHNGWANQDKYFHCRANCEAAQRGKSGETAAKCMSDAKEEFDQGWPKYDSPESSVADQAANQAGREGGAANPSGDCRQICGRYRPDGSFPTRF